MGANSTMNFYKIGGKFISYKSGSWYNGTIEPDNFSDDVLNDYEKANLELIISYENRP